MAMNEKIFKEVLTCYLKALKIEEYIINNLEYTDYFTGTDNPYWYMIEKRNESINNAVRMMKYYSSIKVELLRPHQRNAKQKYKLIADELYRQKNCLRASA